MLTVSGLAKRFGRTRALSDVSLFVESGEIAALVGENGSGKSTVLSILAGLIRTDLGAASLDDQRLIGRRASARQRIGYVPEKADPPPQMTGNQLFGLVCSIKSAPLPTDKRLARLGLDRGNLLARPCAGLSLGERRRLCLAAATIGEPRLILADEPSNGLDSGGTEMLANVLIECAANGAIVLIATHDRELVESLGALVIPIANGTALRD